MKRWIKMARIAKSLGIVVFLFLLLGFSTRASAQFLDCEETCTWNGEGELYQWGDPDNWSCTKPDYVPGANDAAILSSAGTVQGVPQRVCDLSISNTILELGTIAVRENLYWSNGGFVAATGGGSCSVTALRNALIGGSEMKELRGCELNLQGATRWSGGLLYMVSGSALNNEVGGTLVFDGSASFTSGIQAGNPVNNR
ncbi:MAG: hypothetical protein R3178_04175, partial [Rhodothermales bacterium]|nr:hypothetical protein [Rhodothermales bacterium]